MFQYRLAANVFHCDVDEMLARIDSRRLAEWEAYDRLEPIDLAGRIELAAGIIAQTIANVHRDAKTTDPYSGADFMKNWREKWETAAADPAEAQKIIAAKVESAAAALGLSWQ